MWHYLVGDQPIGPVTEEQLLQFIRNGSLSPQTLIWAEGMPNWVPVTQSTLAAQVNSFPTIVPVTRVLQNESEKPKSNQWSVPLSSAFGAIIGFVVFKSLPTRVAFAILGGAAAGLVWGLIPYFVGRHRAPKLAKISIWCCVLSGMAFGTLLALPVAVIFAIILLCKPSGATYRVGGEE